MWSIHENRVRKGLGSTVSKSGLYDRTAHKQDANFQLNGGMSISREQILEGHLPKTYLDNAFLRWNEKIDQNPHHQDDIDDHVLYEIDNFERMKPYQAAEKDVVGTHQVIPMDDDDGKLTFYDIQGESLYTNPKDPNLPTIDHGLDEDNVWAFQMSVYNQNAVINDWGTNPYKAMQVTHVPFWGLKLSTPVFYKDEKYEKFLKQWKQRIGLEIIKIRQSMALRPGDVNQRMQNKYEIQKYISDVIESQTDDAMKDVYITDHIKKTEKLLTFSEEEDEQFYKYHQSLNSYKKKTSLSTQQPKLKYEKGSLAQRIFDPLAGATRNENGTLVYEVADNELSYNMNMDRLRLEFNNANNQEILEAEEAEDLRVALMEEIQKNDLPLDNWNEYLDRELSVFKDGAKYDYVTDIADAYKAGLAKPLASKIFDTIPDHVFWDIKRPINAEKRLPMNPYNPARRVANDSFFEFRV